MKNESGEKAMNEMDAELERGFTDRIDEARSESGKLVDLEKAFGRRWYSRYRHRPLVDSIFGGKT